MPKARSHNMHTILLCIQLNFNTSYFISHQGRKKHRKSWGGGGYLLARALLDKTINPVVGQIQISLAHNTINNIDSLCSRAYVNMFRLGNTKGIFDVKLVFTVPRVCTKRVLFITKRALWSYLKILGGARAHCALGSYAPVSHICNALHALYYHHSFNGFFPHHFSVVYTI